jgi:hypothetical protein
MSCGITKYIRQNSIFVAVAGGSSGYYSNGGSFTVGVTTVTVVINTACTNYPC